MTFVRHVIGFLLRKETYLSRTNPILCHVCMSSKPKFLLEQLMGICDPADSESDMRNKMPEESAQHQYNTKTRCPHFINE